MKREEYVQLDGLGIAELVKTKQVHSSEVIENAINIIEKYNPTLNAVIHKLYDESKKTRGDFCSTGRFTGVPMLLKDITQELKGEPITSGSKSLRNYKAKQDSYYVKKLRETGAVFLGQTNVPEFALMGVTEPDYYGPTKNPWNFNYTPGGSSGGSAAAIASGMVPIAGANDGGGSIRIPAGYCGLVGLKPTRGRTPVGPVNGRHWQGASVDHVVTRTVRDSAAMLDELNVYEKTAAFHTQPFKESFLEQTNKPVQKGLKIAFSTTSPIGTEVHIECKKAVLNTVKMLESMGHIVEEKEAPVDGNKLALAYIAMYFGEVSATIAQMEKLIGRKVKQSDVEPTSWLLNILGNKMSAKEFVLHLKEWDIAAFQMEKFHETYDFYVTPTTAFPPSKIGELSSSNTENLLINLTSSLHLEGLLYKFGIVDQIVKKSLEKTPFTQLANLTGQPAISLPLHLTDDGLPIGVQFIAARNEEAELIKIASVLECTDIWQDIKENPYIKEIFRLQFNKKHI